MHFGTFPLSPRQFHTQNVERSWKSAKERNKRHNGTHRQMLDSYMCEWMWRKRNANNNLFDQILNDISLFRCLKFCVINSYIFSEKKCYALPWCSYHTDMYNNSKNDIYDFYYPWNYN